MPSPIWKLGNRYLELVTGRVASSVRKFDDTMHRVQMSQNELNPDESTVPRMVSGLGRRFGLLWRPICFAFSGFVAVLSLSSLFNVDPVENGANYRIISSFIVWLCCVVCMSIVCFYGWTAANKKSKRVWLAVFVGVTIPSFCCGLLGFSLLLTTLL